MANEPHGSKFSHWKAMFFSSFQKCYEARYLIYSVCGIVIIVAASIWFSLGLEAHIQKLALAVTMTGACGGLLFAVRQSVLEWPKVDCSQIQLGWVADSAYGIAGAFCVFLLVPGLSESAQDGFLLLFPIANQSSQSPPDDGMDFLEVIAVALVGGFAGRSVMQQAQQNVLARSGQQSVTTAKEEDARSQQDALALSLVNRVLHGDPNPPSHTEITKELSTASLSTQRTIFHLVDAYCEKSKSQSFSEGLLNLLTALETSRIGQVDYRVSAWRAQAMAQTKDLNEAIRSSQNAIAIALKNNVDPDTIQHLREALGSYAGQAADASTESS